LIWNRGEPPPQPSSVTLNFVASCVRLENVVTPVSVKLKPLASFAVEASERSETSLTWFPASSRRRTAPRSCHGRRHEGDDGERRQKRDRSPHVQLSFVVCSPKKMLFNP
jgi:hypothetical protein